MSLSSIPQCLLGIGSPWNPSSWAWKVLIGASKSGSKVDSSLVFLLEVTGFEVGSAEIGLFGDSGGFVFLVVRVLSVNSRRHQDLFIIVVNVLCL